MAALDRKDFFKYEDDVKRDRKLLILKMYKNGEAFELKDGANVVFKFEQKIYNKIAGLTSNDKKSYDEVTFTTTKNQKKKLTDLAKSEKLGGGKGSGGGAKNTRTQESSVCLWCAVYKEYKKSDQATVIKNYSKVKSLYDVDETDKIMINQKTPEWLNHYEKVSTFLMGGMFKSGNYEFHRGSKRVDRIYDVYKRLNKLLEVPFTDQNKWNPGDIWVFKKGFDLPGIEDCQTIDCLNRYLLNGLKKKNMVGISLKLIENPNKVNTKSFNVGEERPPIKWNGFRVAAEGKDIFGSKDVYIYAKGEDEINMQFRSFDNLSGWQGELLGKKAKYGKAAYGIVNRNLKDLKLNTLPAQQDIVTKAKEKDEKLAKELYNMFKKYTKPGMTLEKFMTNVKSTSTKADWLYSKYLGVKMIDTLMSTTPKNRDKFTQGMVGYALSNSKDSSAFIKIY